jgi:hypothetical protein
MNKVLNLFIDSSAPKQRKKPFVFLSYLSIILFIVAIYFLIRSGFNNSFKWFCLYLGFSTLISSIENWINKEKKDMIILPFVVAVCNFIYFFYWIIK